MSLDLSLLISRPVVSLKSSESRRTVPREARLARMMVRSSEKDVKDWGIDGSFADVRKVMWGGGVPWL